MCTHTWQVRGINQVHNLAVLLNQAFRRWSTPNAEHGRSEKQIRHQTSLCLALALPCLFYICPSNLTNKTRSEVPDRGRVGDGQWRQPAPASPSPACQPRGQHQTGGATSDLCGMWEAQAKQSIVRVKGCYSNTLKKNSPACSVRQGRPLKQGSRPWLTWFSGLRL